MVKGCLKVSILFKTDILPKCFAPHNAQLVISNHSYVEVFFLGPSYFDITSLAVVISTLPSHTTTGVIKSFYELSIVKAWLQNIFRHVLLKIYMRIKLYTIFKTLDLDFDMYVLVYF